MIEVFQTQNSNGILNHNIHCSKKISSLVKFSFEGNHEEEMKLHMYTDPNSDHPMAKYRYKTVNGHHSISTTPTIHSSSVANSVATTSVVALATEVTIADRRKQSGMCSQL